MTRINVVPVHELSRQHLIAEYREIMRLPKNLNKSLNRKTKPFTMDEIPGEYTLGQGHVKFFYNKFSFLQSRFRQLSNEMQRRGYKVNFTDITIFNQPQAFMGNYIPTAKALKINRQRIKERS